MVANKIGMRIRSLFGTLIVAAAGIVPVAASACGTPPAFAPPTFGEPMIIDPVQAGGEPSIQPLADGSLLYASHAGTTHLLKTGNPVGWASTYDGTINTWRSTDAGVSWVPADLLEQTTGLPIPAGFSDPSTAVDAAGNVYLSAIDTKTVYVGRSADGSRFVGNHLASLNMDREWIAADTAGVVYMIATPFTTPWPDGGDHGPLDPFASRVLWRSVDGAASWEQPLGSELPGSGSMSPIVVNPSDGSLVWPATQPSQSGFVPADVVVFPNARSGNLSTMRTTKVRPGLPHSGGFFNSSAVDDVGNIYIVANTSREVWLFDSTDGGRSFRQSIVAKVPGRVVWPWVSAGADGRVGISWFESLGDQWRVMAAFSFTAHGWVDGCGEARYPTWVTSTVTEQPFHRGYICDGGLGCNTDPGTTGDRRLGDYHTNAITPDGRFVIAFGDTAHDPMAAVSHPAFVGQIGGGPLR